MKKLLLSALAIILAMGLMGSAFAYFSDTETSEGNTFTAGTFNLTLDGESLPLHSWNMKPGDGDFEEHGVQNVGTIAGEVWFTAENFAEPSGYWEEPPEPESGIEVGPRDFADILRIKIYADLDDSHSFEEDELIYHDTVLKLEEGSDRFAIAAGQYMRCKFVIWLPSDVGNDYQADGVAWDIVWHGTTEITISP